MGLASDCSKVSKGRRYPECGDALRDEMDGAGVGRGFYAEDSVPFKSLFHQAVVTGMLYKAYLSLCDDMDVRGAVGCGPMTPVSNWEWRLCQIFQNSHKYNPAGFGACHFLKIFL